MGAERLQGSGYVKAGQQPGGGQSVATSRADFTGGVMKKYFKKICQPVGKDKVAGVGSLKRGRFTMLEKAR